MKNKINTNLATQYDTFASEFADLHEVSNVKTRRDVTNAIKSIISSSNKHPKILDLGCGAGADLALYRSLGCIPSGVDSSSEMCTLAKAKVQGAVILNEPFDKKMSFKDKSFDIIASKWALQTAKDILPIYQESFRLLKKGGHIVFLVVHPLRQFLEKKKKGKNYFKKELVTSVFFGGRCTAIEPSHTMEEYLSTYFFEHFTLVSIKEDFEFPDAEQVDGDTYPTYLMIVAKRK